jgi:hypothetical protein
MSYLYGDSTPSPLKSNFIQFLGEAIDFSVNALQAAAQLDLLRKRILATKENAEAETTRLEAIGVSVAAAIERTPKGALESPTATCAKAVLVSVTELVEKSALLTAATLATDVAALQVQETEQREACERALEGLLRAHDPPGTTATVHLLAGEDGEHYAATRRTQTPFGLECVMELEIAAPHALSQVARVDKFVPHLEIQAPESGGWLRKEIKNRPQRLEKHYLTEMSFAPGASSLRLRASVDAGAHGFDVEVRDTTPRVQIVRIGDASESPASFEISEADAAKMLALHEKLQASALEAGQNRTRLVSASLDQRPFVEVPDPGSFVDRLVGAMAPVVREIAQHSLAPGELVLKRLMGDHRREEIFVSKASLDEKLKVLPEVQRSRFRALGLSAILSQQPPSEARPKTATLPGPLSAPAAEASVVVAEEEEVDVTAAFELQGRPSSPGPS